MNDHEIERDEDILIADIQQIHEISLRCEQAITENRLTNAKEYARQINELANIIIIGLHQYDD